ncbi:MAG: ribonuclease R [Ruminococcaceae bacterium]|nr:ribonuclease R [Oscillospiraceae bacterium]
MSLRSNLLKTLGQGPKSLKQLREKLGAPPKKLAKHLKALLAEQKIVFDGGQYALAGDADAPLVDGRLVKLGASFGFVAPLDGSADIFIPGSKLAGAMPQDVVRVVLADKPRVAGSREGRVRSILQPNDRLAGTVEIEDGRLVLLPDNAPDTPLPVKRSADGGAKPGEKVAAQILERGDRHDDHRVGVIQRFGSADSAKQCAKAILFSAGITKSFPDAVKQEAKSAAALKLTKEQLKGRSDLRKETIFTIDSAHTKDMDDAVSARKTENGYVLSVHIADVSHYVPGKSLLDEEALARGTSIYYADSVVPMLPRALSNEACSLNPGEDRLAFSCIMELDRDARLQQYRFEKSVICSKVKGVYSEINTLFDGTADQEIAERYSDVLEKIWLMEEIYHKLAALRQARGSMEIESEEPLLLVDPEGRTVGIERRQRGKAERLIEEFMLLANTAAAQLAEERNIPFIYRVHDNPSPDKVEQLKAVLTAVGLEVHFASDRPTQAELGAILDKTRGTNLEIPVHQAVLRSMAKAKYEAEAKGHYGLALDDYAHFTSPIRRYPDLAIHRILSDVVAGATREQLQKRYGHFAKQAAEQSSERELLAQRLERDCDASYKAEYMKRYIGQTFDGVIVAVAPHGLYVALPNTVEGLVHNAHLADYKLEVQEGVRLLDPATGKSWRVGDAMAVRLLAADVSRGQIDFAPA